MSKSDFGKLITQTLRGAGIRKSNLAEALEIHSSTLSRALSGEINKPLAIAIIYTVNRLAKSQILDESNVLQMLDFSPIADTKEFPLVKGLSLSADSSISDSDLMRILDDFKLTLEFRKAHI